MTKSKIATKREFVRVLKRRENHLRQRIEQSGALLSYDRSEAAALHWAIKTLTELLESTVR